MVVSIDQEHAFQFFLHLRLFHYLKKKKFHSSCFLYLFPILVGVAIQIEKLQRDLLWVGFDNEFKFYLVN